MTIEIFGRTRYADTATTVVSIYRSGYRSPESLVMKIHGALIEERQDGAFVLASKHESATDVEHDSSYVAYLEGAGLRYQHMNPNGMTMTGVILSAQHYDTPDPVTAFSTGECDSCKEPHPFLKFTPPKAKWTPANYLIEVEFVAPEPKEVALDQGDLRERLDRAIARLEERHKEAEFAAPAEYRRLGGKIEGVKLARSYLHDAERALGS